MRIYPIFLPRGGCPHHCLFCRQEGEGEGGLPDPSYVGDFLERAISSAGEGEIAFYGGTFTLVPEETKRAYLEVARRFVRTGRVGGIRISTRPDALPEAEVEGLARAGVTTVEIGCQSFSEEVLRRSGRGHGPWEAAGAVERLRAYGLNAGLQLMPGLPGATPGEALNSLEAALELIPDFLRIYPTAVFRGTPLEKAWRNGSFKPLSLDEAVEICAEALRRCRRAGVAVIRMGLQGTPGLERDLLAGPWHPAFGQLVRSRLWYRLMEEGAGQTGIFTAAVHPADRAEALGHRRENLLRLRERLNNFTIMPDSSIPRGQVAFGGRKFTL